MTETIKLMKAHTSVRRFKEQEIPQADLEEILTAGQNTLLAAESLGYGGVVIGLVRYKSEEVAELFNLPDYTYPVFGIALGVPNQQHDVKPRLPLSQVVFEEEYQEQPVAAILDYDQVQADYAGARATTSWSQRLAEQFGQAEPSSTRKNLEQKKLL